MRYFPIFMDLKGRHCLVTGGGAAALAKVRLLARTPAQITLIAPFLEREAEKEIRALVAQGRVRLIERKARDHDLENVDLLYLADGDAPEEAHLAGLARRRGLIVNAVDRPLLSDFITPSIVDREPVVVALSSSGAAPVLVRDLRARIEALLPRRLGKLARFAERFRAGVKATFPALSARRRFWENFFNSPLSRRFLEGRERGAAEEMLKRINGLQGPTSGSVALVGAGPGDPDLLTFKALHYLQRADLIVYDRLVAPEILDYARRDAERLYAGKAKGGHVMTQEEINLNLLRAAKAGKRVVRLKGGDPFVFGRGGEELAFLKAHGIEVDIVPGVTAALACAASARVALTERGKAQAVTFVTGHGAEGEPELDWAKLVGLGQTICLYMGLSRLPGLVARLMDEGLPASTPTALIEKGTLEGERILRAHLGDLPAVAQGEALSGPAMILIGEVVRETALSECDFPWEEPGLAAGVLAG